MSARRLRKEILQLEDKINAIDDEIEVIEMKLMHVKGDQAKHLTETLSTLDKQAEELEQEIRAKKKQLAKVDPNYEFDEDDGSDTDGTKDSSLSVSPSTTPRQSPRSNVLHSAPSTPTSSTPSPSVTSTSSKPSLASSTPDAATSTTPRTPVTPVSDKKEEKKLQKAKEKEEKKIKKEKEKAEKEKAEKEKADKKEKEKAEKERKEKEKAKEKEKVDDKKDKIRVEKDKVKEREATRKDSKQKISHRSSLFLSPNNSSSNAIKGRTKKKSFTKGIFGKGKAKVHTPDEFDRFSVSEVLQKFEAYLDSIDMVDITMRSVWYEKYSSVAEKREHLRDVKFAEKIKTADTFVQDLKASPDAEKLKQVVEYFQNANATWIEDFIENGGTKVLFDQIVFELFRASTTKTGLEAEDTYNLQLLSKAIYEGVNNGAIGADDLGEEVVRAVTLSLQFLPLESKTEIMDFLATICILSPEVHVFVLDAIQYYKLVKLSSFRNAIDEFEHGEDIAYKVALLKLVNSLVVRCAELEDRVSVRQLFLQEGLGTALEKLKVECPDSDLQEQFEAFDAELDADLAEAGIEKDELLTDSVASQDPADLFASIWDDVQNIGVEAKFIAIMNTLVSMCSIKETASDEGHNTWRVLYTIMHQYEQFIKRSDKLESFSTEDALLQILGRSAMSDSNMSKAELTRTVTDGLKEALNEVTQEDEKKEEATTEENKEGTNTEEKKEEANTDEKKEEGKAEESTTEEKKADSESKEEKVPITGGPPPPPMIGAPVTGGPPPPPMMIGGGPPPPPMMMGGGPPPPPMMMGSGGPPPPPGMAIQLSPYYSKEKRKMVPVRWNAIPQRMVEKTVFGKVDATKVAFDDELGELLQNTFKKEEIKKKAATTNSNKPAKKEEKTAVVLDQQRCTVIEIIMKRFDQDVSFIKDAINNVDLSFLTLDRLSELASLFPMKSYQEEHQKLVTKYTGKVEDLSRPEIFLRELFTVTNVRDKLFSLSFCVEFPTKLIEFEESLKIVTKAFEELKNEKIVGTLQYVLAMGNYINNSQKQTYGFKFNTLMKLGDVKARNSKVTMLHMLATIIQKKEPELLSFVNECDTVPLAVPAIGALQAGFSYFSKNQNLLNKQLKSYTEEEAALKAQLETVATQLAGAIEQYNESITSFEKSIEYYGESNTKDIVGFLTSWKQFIYSYKSAIKFNIALAKKEEQQREKEAQEKNKRKKKLAEKQRAKKFAGTMRRAHGIKFDFSDADAAANAKPKQSASTKAKERRRRKKKEDSQVDCSDLLDSIMNDEEKQKSPRNAANLRQDRAVVKKLGAGLQRSVTFAQLRDRRGKFVKNAEQGGVTVAQKVPEALSSLPTESSLPKAQPTRALASSGQFNTSLSIRRKKKNNKNTLNVDVRRQLTKQKSTLRMRKRNNGQQSVWNNNFFQPPT